MSTARLLLLKSIYCPRQLCFIDFIHTKTCNNERNTIYVKNFANSYHPFRRVVRPLPLFIKHNSVMDIPGKHKRQIKLWINSVTSVTNGLLTRGMRQLPIQFTAQTPAKNAPLSLVQNSWSQGFHHSLELLFPKNQSSRLKGLSGLNALLDGKNLT